MPNSTVTNIARLCKHYQKTRSYTEFADTISYCSTIPTSGKLDSSYSDSDVCTVLKETDVQSSLRPFWPQPTEFRDVVDDQRPDFDSYCWEEPDSYEIYKSLADNYMRIGDRKSALNYYREV